jgi:uncharacterized membrane protein (DUF2068 family)
VTRPPRAARAAAILYGALGVGFGLGTIVTLALLARDGELPMTPWGFRALDGPLARIDTRTTLLAGAALVAVCAADTATAAGLWRGRRWAGWLALVTAPAALVLGLGFELPFLLAGIPPRTALVVAAWRRLT